MIQVANGPLLPRAAAVVSYPTVAAWLAARQRGPGSSDAAAILGVSTHGGPWDVYASRCLGGPLNPIDPKLARRGHREESRIVEDYSEETGDTVFGPLQTVSVERDVGHAFPLLDSPDAWILEPTGSWGVGELKTDRTSFRWAPSGIVIDGWSKAAGKLVREDYATQCYWHLACHGLDWCRLVVKRSLDDLRWYTIAADERLQERVVERVAMWWERHVVLREPPPRDATDSCLRAQARIFPPMQRQKVKVPADPGSAELIAEYNALEAEAKAIEQRQRAIKVELAATIGNGYGMTCEDGKALFVDVKGKVRVDRERLRLRFPEAWEACTTTGDPSRELRVTGRTTR